ncbi:MAG: hypothetical protein NW226_20070 [Microscillaceae bacterium]|nr:hypothetical protein [Microscillaceae bacterium]
MENIDPIFVKISENLETNDILNDLIVTPVDIEVGDQLNIGGRTFTVHKVKDENGKLALKNSDLKKNIRSYEELLRTGIVSNYKIDDLCLVNNKNGDVLIEVTIPKDTYRRKNFNHLLHSNQRNFFVRLDGTMINNILTDKKTEFAEHEIKLTPCMFAADSALAITQNGQKISITERNRSIDDPVIELITNNSFTLYEKEIVGRLVGTVNLLALSSKIDKITTALPRGAYYSFLFQGASDGFVSPEIVLDWFDIVDRRVKYLRLLIKKGIHQYHPHIPIEQYSFMDSACDALRTYFEERLKDNKKPDIDELLDLTLNTILEQDSFARQIYGETAIQRPRNFQDLANFTYAVGNLTDMEIKPGVSPQPKQIIGVYDVTETMMWIAAKKIRNRGILEPRGLFNNNVPQNSVYDHLSFISVMPIEHVIFDISPEFAEKHMGGFTRLYSVREGTLSEEFEQDIEDIALGLSPDEN